MWLCQNKSFLSVVAPSPNDPKAAAGDVLLVRARVKGHINNVFPAAEEIEVLGRDYQFRAYIPRAEVATAIAAAVTAIDYPNFKNSVQDHELHKAYADVWGVMAKMQEFPPYQTRPRKPAARITAATSRQHD